MATGDDRLGWDAVDHSESYPADDLAEVKEDRRGYRDDAAAVLYKAAGVNKLAQSHAAMCRALGNQAAKLETFYNTPFTEQHIQTMKTTLEGIERVERLLERWHLLLFPNQAPTKEHRDVG